MGNILTSSDGTTSHTYTYGNAVWKDLLTAFDGETFYYDANGNPTGYYNGAWWDMQREEGRRLVTASTFGSTINFTYDSDGLRLTKTVSDYPSQTTTYNYFYAGGKLIRQTDGTNTLDFFYDESGHPYAVTHSVGESSNTYYYVTNLQGDVLHIVNGFGTPVVSYSYDPYGKPTITSDTSDVSLGTINPLRYRGYVYDSETGFYYLQSRYYDPAICRFINADSYASTGQGIIGCNMFAYCRNNPIRRKDACGTLDEETDQDLFSKLEALLDTYATIDEYGFSINLEAATADWNACIQEIGVQEAYDYMSDYLCQKYFDTYGEEFLFSNDCVSYEIEYHVDAYMCMKGYSGYERNVTTLIFTKDYLIEHCKVVNISTEDVTNVKQSVMFEYRNGIRSKYVGTDKDPYWITTINIFGYEIILR